jgi:hypothetical protein
MDESSIENKVFLDIDAARAAGVARPIPWKSAIWRVYPEQAKYWLENKGPNRKIASNGVFRFMTEMLGDYWKTTPEGLIFDENGRLIDGQTRLTAFVGSGLPFTDFVVCYGVSSDILPVINRHKIRDYIARKQIKDALDGEPVSESVVMRVTNVIIRYGGIHADGDIVLPHGYNIPQGMFDELVDEYYPAAEFALSLLPKTRGKIAKKLYVTPFPAAVALAHLNGVAKTTLREFVKVYLNSEKGPGQLLHDYMLTHSTGGFNGIVYALGTTQKAIKAFVDGDKLDVLYKTRKIEYPVPALTDGQVMTIIRAVEAMKAAETANKKSEEAVTKITVGTTAA